MSISFEDSVHFALIRILGEFDLIKKILAYDKVVMCPFLLMTKFILNKPESQESLS